MFTTYCPLLEATAKRIRERPPLSLRRIAVTGVAGFIGSNLAVRLLSEGYEVIGIDNLAYGISGTDSRRRRLSSR